MTPVELGLAGRDLFAEDPDVPYRDGFGGSGFPVPRFAMEGSQTESTLVGGAELPPARPPARAETGDTALPSLAAALEDEAERASEAVRDHRRRRRGGPRDLLRRLPADRRARARAGGGGGLRAELPGVPFLGAFTFGEAGWLGGANRHGNLMISVLVFARGGPP